MLFKSKKASANRVDIFENYPVKKAVLTFAIPTIFNAMMTTLYNLVDTFWISQTNDPSMVAGVSLGMSAMHLLGGVGTIFSMGGSSLISRCLGSKEFDKAKKTSSFCIYMCLIWSIIVTIFTLIFEEPFARFLGATETSLKYTTEYLFWVTSIGAVPTILSMTLGGQLRAVGYSNHEMIGMVMGHVINFILDPIFIIVLRMNVAGAALATMLSNLIATTYFIVFIARMKDETVLNANPKNFRITAKHMGEIFVVGIPAAMENLLASASGVILNNLLGSYGDNYIAALGIVQKLDQFPTQFSSGFTNGSVPMIGYNYAAKKYKRMEDTRKYAMKMTLIICLIFFALYQIFAKQLFGIFLDDPEILDLGARFLRIYVICVPIMTMIFTIRSTFQAVGKGPSALFVSVCRRGLIFIPTVYALNALFGVYGVICTQPIADAISLVISIVLYRRFRKGFEKELLEQSAAG